AAARRSQSGGEDAHRCDVRGKRPAELKCIRAWAEAVVECGVGAGQLDWWELTPVETHAIQKAWAKRERRESKRFANLMAVLTGTTTDTFLPPEKTEETPEEI